MFKNTSFTLLVILESVLKEKDKNYPSVIVAYVFQTHTLSNTQFHLAETGESIFLGGKLC